MSTYSLSHVSDHALLRDLAALVARDRATTAALLAHLAEVDARKLYLPAGYPSMYVYCVEELRLSEDAAYKRLQAARVARQFPALFEALADGRLHLSAVVLLAPHLTAGNAGELLAAAAHRSKSGIEDLLARRFPRSEMLPLVEALPAAPPPHLQLAPGQVERDTAEVGVSSEPVVPVPVEASAPRSKVVPHAPQRFAIHLTIGQSTYQKLQYAQALLGHQVPSGDVVQVLDRALDALIRQLEKGKFAATSKPRQRPRRSGANPRYIPAHVRRAVRERDGGQCTFVSEGGHRCPARSRLEFDHADPVARGGRATVERMRLRCRAHNQHAAECAFGTAFMSRKREEARRSAAARAAAAEHAKERDVVPWLRQLGFRADEARRAAAQCEAHPDASLEERLRLALSFLQPPHRGVVNGRVTAT